MDDLPGEPTAVDALFPSAMAERAERIGAEKTRLDIWRLLTLAVLGGAFIAFGAMFATIAGAGASGMVPYGITRIIVGIVLHKKIPEKKVKWFAAAVFIAFGLWGLYEAVFNGLRN